MADTTVDEGELTLKEMLAADATSAQRSAG